MYSCLVNSMPDKHKGLKINSASATNVQCSYSEFYMILIVHPRDKSKELKFPRAVRVRMQKPNAEVPPSTLTTKNQRLPDLLKDLTLGWGNCSPRLSLAGLRSQYRAFLRLKTMRTLTGMLGKFINVKLVFHMRHG